MAPVALAVTLTVEELRALVREETARAPGQPTATGPEVLTRQDAAKLLQVHPNVISRYVRTLGLPARKIGGEWRFLRSEMMKWVESRERIPMKRQGAAA